MNVGAEGEASRGRQAPEGAPAPGPDGPGSPTRGARPMDPRHAYDELIRRVKEARLLESCGAVLGWDERTYMPHQGSAHRAEQMALLARLAHEMLTHPEIGRLLGELEASPLARDVDGDAAVNVREIRRT